MTIIDDEIVVTIGRLEKPSPCDGDSTTPESSCPNPAEFGVYLTESATVVSDAFVVCPHHVGSAVDTLSSDEYRNEYVDALARVHSNQVADDMMARIRTIKAMSDAAKRDEVAP